MDFSKVKSVYFIGIGGIGTSAIVRMFLLEGKKVNGSDMAESEVTEALREAGATITIQAERMGIFPQSVAGRCPSSIPEGTELVIYTIAIPDEHAELVEAKKRGIPVLSYPETLGVISREKYTIAITGTHGKTTTTAMVAKVLMDAGLDPTVIVGSFLLDAPPQPPDFGRSPLKKGALHSDAGGLFGAEGTTTPASEDGGTPFIKGDKVLVRTNFVAGKSKYLAVEACEYRRSFLNINPTIVVITNIDDDHLDYYKDIKDIEKAFAEFVAKLPKSGFVVCDLKDKSVRNAVKSAPCAVIDYGGADIKGLKLKVPGKHNILNAKATLAVAEILGINHSVALRALNKFSGTWRRFEYRGKAKNGALVYDDYGHHPTEIKATLAGARELHPTKRIIVVFQPHLYSRTKLLLPKFAKAFGDADKIYLAPIYAAREPFDASISSEMLVKAIGQNETEKSVRFMDSFEEIAAHLRVNVSSRDVIITVGAGDIYKVAEKLLK